MAKLSSKRFSEVARITTEFRADHLTAPVRYLWVYRSDGKVLRRMTGEYGSAYSIFGAVKANYAADFATSLLVKLATDRGHTIVKRGK